MAHYNVFGESQNKPWIYGGVLRVVVIQFRTAVPFLLIPRLVLG